LSPARRTADSNFSSDRHALYMGWVVGKALQHGLKITPELDDDGQFTDRLTLQLPDDARYTLTVVVPPPPDDWEPA
jgi:hypothetical protein